MAPSALQLRKHHRRTGLMLADPDLTGELLLLGLGLARLIDLDQPDGPWRITDVIALLYPIPSYAHGPAWVAHRRRHILQLLREDVPHYQPPVTATVCLFPKSADELCARKPSYGATLTDPVTGEQEALRACPAHADWGRAAAADNRRLLAAASPVPQPPFNAGGRLAGHLPELQWPQLWLSLKPDYSPPVEAPGMPRLRVLPGASSGRLRPVVARPRLTVVPEPRT